MLRRAALGAAFLLATAAVVYPAYAGDDDEPGAEPEGAPAETAAATEILGLDWRHNLGLPNRSLEPTLEARRELAIVIRQTRPRWLFAPYWIDAHPDHLAATQLVARLSRTGCRRVEGSSGHAALFDHASDAAGGRCRHGGVIGRFPFSREEWFVNAQVQ